jgi:hypothetical protein
VKAGFEDRHRERLAVYRFDAQKRHVGTVLIFEVQDSGETEHQAVGPAEFLDEVDVRGHRGAAKAQPEDEAGAAPASELGRHVTIGDDDVAVDEPPGAEPGQRVTFNLDTPDRPCRLHEMGFRPFQARLPHDAVRIGKRQLTLVPENREDRTSRPPDDRFGNEFLAVDLHAFNGHFGLVAGSAGLSRRFRAVAAFGELVPQGARCPHSRP